jgi:NAD(P)H-dependent flavin oxidoreductase YrpB (nitropropane dioxygenase family)
MTGTTTLVALLAQHIRGVPLLAAGGIMTGQQMAAALAAGMHTMSLLPTLGASYGWLPW